MQLRKLTAVSTMYAWRSPVSCSGRKQANISAVLTADTAVTSLTTLRVAWRTTHGKRVSLSYHGMASWGTFSNGSANVFVRVRLVLARVQRPQNASYTDPIWTDIQSTARLVHRWRRYEHDDGDGRDTCAVPDRGFSKENLARSQR